MPKPVYATADELAEAVKKLEGQVAAAQAKIAPAVKACENKLTGDIGKLNDTVTANDKKMQDAVAQSSNKSISDTSTQVGKLRTDIDNQLSTLRIEFQGGDTNLTNKINQVDAEVRQTVASELEALCSRIDQEFNSTRQGITSDIEVKRAETERNLEAARVNLDNLIKETATEAERQLAESKAALEKAMEKARAAQAKDDERRDEKSQRSESEIWLKLGRIDELLKEVDVKTDQLNDEVRTETSNNLQSYREEANQRLDGHDEEGLKIRTAILEVENLATRRVDWVIKNASKRLRPNSASKACLHTSWFSPKFDMAGCHGLQLELQLFRPSDIGVDGEATGDIAIYLWACKGMNLVFKLFCGTKSQSCEKVFNGKVPYGTTRFCFLKDTINREDDTLKISVEILEAVRELEHVLKPIPPPTAEELEGASQAEKELAEKMALKQVPGSLFFRRHVNNRILDQVKSQVDAMRSRMVRRVEWRIEKASLLRRCFPTNESMCSASFNAAGIEGLQFIFYPSGYNGSTDGFCSLYMYAPSGATLRCNLFVGDQKRDANHTYEVAGAFGRTNFCRLDAGIEIQDDTITIALDIEEAHQDKSATVAHPTVAPGDRRSQGQIDGAPEGPIESTVKLQASSGKVAKGGGLDEKRVLPSLWTAKSLGEKTPGKDDAFHSFDDFGKSKSQGFSPGSVMGSTKRSESMPSFRDDGGLPKLSKSAGDWGNSTSEWSVGSKPRGPGRKNRGFLSSSPSPVSSPVI